VTPPPGSHAEAGADEASSATSSDLRSDSELDSSDLGSVDELDEEGEAALMLYEQLAGQLVAGGQLDEDDLAELAELGEYGVDSEDSLGSRSMDDLDDYSD